MTTVTLNLPDSIDMNQKDLLSFVAAKLYESGKLTMGQAAEMAGYTKATFMEIIGNYNVSVFNYPASEFERDLNNA
jgi:predicted HTH domain antitoxin